MPSIEDGAQQDKKEKKKHKKYVLKTVEKQKMKEEALDEVAPPGKKYERMVKHIKKNYPKDKEGIAYATAWKHKNKNKQDSRVLCTLMLGQIVEIVKPLLFAAMNSCHTKKLVVELLERYVNTTDNDIDNLIAGSVRTALLKNCK